MSDFATSWVLSRGRFVDALDGLNQEQLNWRMHADSLTIGEMALHVAGVEVSFISQLLGLELDSFQRQVKSAATDGVVNDRAFPFASVDITHQTVRDALAMSRELVEPVITSPSDAVRSKQIVSALGPVIDGNGALARLAFHSGYHQGQVHLVRTSPRFP